MPCGFESHLSHQKREGTKGTLSFLVWVVRTRKAVKKTCRWHVFRPWESPSKSRCIRYGCRWVLNMCDAEKPLVRAHLFNKFYKSIGTKIPVIPYGVAGSFCVSKTLSLRASAHTGAPQGGLSCPSGNSPSGNPFSKCFVFDHSSCIIKMFLIRIPTSLRSSE